MLLIMKTLFGNINITRSYIKMQDKKKQKMLEKIKSIDDDIIKLRKY